MSQPAFFQALSYSPIIAKFAPGVYGLRGAETSPGVIESLMPPRIQQKILEDFGWTSDGRVWLGLRISKAMLQSGVFTIPGGMRKFVQGDFSLKAADGAQICDLNVKGFNAWSLGAFFNRRGGEPGDYLAITFDSKSREAKAYLGDKDLLDEFRPYE